MQSNFYVGLSAQLSLFKRLETIAHNVSNTSTAGFRAEEVKFESFLSNAGTDPVAFVSADKTYLSQRAGDIVRTDNPLDVALEGNAWIGIQTPAGTVYTRDGRMRMTEAGELQTLNGYPILDTGGSPLRLEANGGPPNIARDGTVTQAGRQVGAVGLFNIDSKANLRRFDNSGVIPDRAATPVVDFTTAGMQQGFVERSNVNPVMEMTRLIMVQHAFDTVTATLRDSESAQQDAIRSLASSS